MSSFKNIATGSDEGPSLLQCYHQIKTILHQLNELFLTKLLPDDSSIPMSHSGHVTIINIRTNNLWSYSHMKQCMENLLSNPVSVAWHKFVIFAIIINNYNKSDESDEPPKRSTALMGKKACNVKSAKCYNSVLCTTAAGALCWTPETLHPDYLKSLSVARWLCHAWVQLWACG